MDQRITDKPPKSWGDITDQPPGSDPWGGVPPWERPGWFRLDVKPHRGTLLCRLGQMAFLVWPVALVGSNTTIYALPVVCAPAGLVALVLGLLVWWLARRDLKRMLRGAMDPAGATEATEARQLGRAAACLGALVLAWGVWAVRWR
jgi:1,4-dihydroxy-2-naphthoate octaprenyltransferase